MENNVTRLMAPELDDEQRQHWLNRAAYWAIQEEDGIDQIYATERRNHALQMLGMLGITSVGQP